MGKRKADQPNSPAPDAPGSAPVKLEAAAAETAPTGEQLARIDAPELVPAEPNVTAPPAEAITPAPPPPIEMVAVAPPIVAIEPAKAEAASSAPPIAPPEPVQPEPMVPSEAAPAAATSPWSWMQVPRVTPLAAGIAIAAVVGAMAGSVATAGLGGLWASPAPAAKTADARPLRDSIARLNSELAALKASIENAGRTANAQFSKLGDRLDRVEHAQAEPAARLAKLAEAVERIEHHAPASAATSHDVTGSIAAPATQAAAPVRPAGPPIIDGWIVRSVYNGAALIQARYGGVIEVEPGDSLPGLGRIENIRRQDGRWVVVTSRGMIVAR